MAEDFAFNQSTRAEVVQIQPEAWPGVFFQACSVIACVHEILQEEALDHVSYIRDSAQQVRNASGALSAVLHLAKSTADLHRYTGRVLILGLTTQGN